MSRTIRNLLAPALLLACAPALYGFCGFYVAKADTGLFNQASKVVLVRDGQRTVMTMANDFQGEPDEFAIVIPVPTFLEREQIHVGERAVIDHLDAYTAPRLVEYFDPDPCRRVLYEQLRRSSKAMPAAGVARQDAAARSLGVTIEARYSVGEYDILILSAKESNGLVRWLEGSGYRLPQGAERVVSSYLKQDMRFFVAKVNLEQQERLGYRFLRPLQVAYESPRFMLPIRLGTLNARGEQELFVFALTRTGRVETVNYRTVKLPTGMDIPPFVKSKFGSFYKDMFAQQVAEQRNAVFLEYAWDMAWCDPCAAEPLSRQELAELGVFWLGNPLTSTRRPDIVPQPRPQNVFVTRLHLRYTGDTFPEDLRFQETGDRTNFQGRYVLRQPFKGAASCSAAGSYFQQVAERQTREAETLANLTGWDLAKIHLKLDLPRPTPVDSGESWWKRLWPGN